MSEQISKYADVRAGFHFSIDITDCNIADEQLLLSLTFNQRTKWPKSSNMPDNLSPDMIMEMAKNPGLGVKYIHDNGITGKGVNVAIIDQPLFFDHPEYINKIIKYKDFDCDSDNSMHGPAVTSLLVGNTIGTAPNANVYYAAVPSWLQDTEYYSQALNWIIEENRSLTTKDKIKVVSVSAAPSGKGTYYNRNTEKWDLSVQKANESGLLVLDCTSHMGIVQPCYIDIFDLDNINKCVPGFPGMEHKYPKPNSIYVPSSPRTTAEQYNMGEYSYQYYGRGGLSWAIPYCVGVLALGWQLKPEYSYKDMLDALYNTAYEKDSFRYINPIEFIRAISPNAL